MLQKCFWNGNSFKLTHESVEKQIMRNYIKLKILTNNFQSVEFGITKSNKAILGKADPSPEQDLVHCQRFRRSNKKTLNRSSQEDGTNVRDWSKKKALNRSSQEDGTNVHEQSSNNNQPHPEKGRLQTKAVCYEILFQKVWLIVKWCKLHQTGGLKQNIVNITNGTKEKCVE